MTKTNGFIIAILGIWVVSCTVLPAAQAGGGDIVGNGGNLYICEIEYENGARRTVELLDFYEGREMRGLTIDLGPAVLDPIAKIQLALTRLHRLDPERAERFLKRAEGFFDDLLFVKGSLTQIPDYGYIVVEYGCSIEQIARQRQRQYSEDRTFWIRKELWDSLDNNSKAGLILHEIIYEELIKGGAENSIDARYLTALVSSKELESRSFPDYVENTLNKLRVDEEYQQIRIGDARYYSKSLDFYSNGKLARATASGSGWIESHGQVFGVGANDVLSFYKDGAIRRWSPVNAMHVQVNGRQISAQDVLFYENGTVNEIFTFAIEQTFSTFDGEIQFSWNSFSFWPNGMIQSGRLLWKSELTQADGSRISVPTLKGLLFDESGKIVKTGPFNVAGKWVCFDHTDESSAKTGVRVITIHNVAYNGELIEVERNSLQLFAIDSGTCRTTREFTLLNVNGGLFSAKDAKLEISDNLIRGADLEEDYYPGNFAYWTDGKKTEVQLVCRATYAQEKIYSPLN